MTRRRWVYRDGVAIEVGLDYTPPAKNADSLLWNDRTYQDMNDPRFSSRQQHREYMAKNGLTTADDFTGTWAKAAEERAKFFQGVDPSRKRDIVEGLQRMQNGHQRRA